MGLRRLSREGDARPEFSPAAGRALRRRQACSSGRNSYLFLGFFINTGSFHEIPGLMRRWAVRERRRPFPSRGHINQYSERETPWTRPFIKYNLKGVSDVN